MVTRITGNQPYLLIPSTQNPRGSPPKTTPKPLMGSMRLSPAEFGQNHGRTDRLQNCFARVLFVICRKFRHMTFASINTLGPSSVGCKQETSHVYMKGCLFKTTHSSQVTIHPLMGFLCNYRGGCFFLQQQHPAGDGN